MKHFPNGNVLYVNSPIFIDAILALFGAALGAGAWLNAMKSPPGYFAASALLFFAVVCFLGILVQRRRTYLFDPSVQTMTWTQGGFFGRSNGEVAFKDIAVTLDSTTGGSGSGLTYRVMMTTPAGPMPITQAYDGDRSGVERQANELRALLGQPVTASLVDDSIRRMAQTNKSIEAVKLLREQSGVSLTDAVRRVDDLRSKNDG